MSNETPGNIVPEIVNPTTKPAARDGKNRTMVIFKGRRMAYFRAQRIATLEPLINRANSKGMSIPAAAKWLGYSKAAVRQWIAILGVKWKRRNHRPMHRLDKTGWEEAIKSGLGAGESQRSIAKRLGAKDAAVSRFIKENGLRIHSWVRKSK